MSLVHLQIGLCVKPILKISGSSAWNKDWMTAMACRRITPAVAFRSHKLNRIQSKVWHLDVRVARRGESSICLLVVGDIFSQRTFFSWCFMSWFWLGSTNSLLWFSDFPRLEADRLEDDTRFHGNGPSFSWSRWSYDDNKSRDIGLYT